MKSLAEEISLLRAERDIRHTLDRYSHAIDYGNEEEYLDCFTEAAVYQVRPDRSSPPQRVEGREALRAYFRGRTPRSVQKHVTTAPLISVDGEQATVESYFIGFNVDDGVPQLFAIGTYHDTVIRSGDDRWRIVERIYEGENGPPV